MQIHTHPHSGASPHQEYHLNSLIKIATVLVILQPTYGFRPADSSQNTITQLNGTHSSVMYTARCGTNTRKPGTTPHTLPPDKTAQESYTHSQYQQKRD